MMNFSVLISVYKNDDIKVFGEALKSVTLYQTIKPSQVVVVKDGRVSYEIDKIIQYIDKYILRSYRKSITKMQIFIIKLSHKTGTYLLLRKIYHKIIDTRR